MEFEGTLAQLGFTLDRETRGVRHFAKRPNQYLTYWVQIRENDEAIFSWEFAIAEYVSTLGLQVGSDEHLNTFLYPKIDSRGPQDAAWLAARIEEAEAKLDAISLL